ncbi:N-acetylmuramoyl-L-alanine amidase [Solimonas sp. SE-A11]|uniref:N-acetylmuramoyl-L-alanine amidase n=1 Tax=Solimonas sp. SE-A11 TaxID=3054954 RepID=UPI00259CCFE9|nr:N-acetylmuramoyl-L-alanine amidase [Solimonas sp. SE-A11]
MRSIVLLAMLFAMPAAFAAELRDLRLWESQDSTRIVFDLSTDAQHKVFTLANPDRIVVDIGGLSPSAMARINRVTGKGLVRRVRSGIQDGGVRVVLDVSEAVNPKSFVLTPNDEHGYRLVLDLPGRPRTAPAAEQAPVVTAAAPVAAPTPVMAAPPAPAMPPMKLQERPVVIAIDAGHGGEDPGARGKSGLEEKEVALAIARKLAKAINAEPGMKAVLTRDGDYFLKLRDRVNIARKHQADLFVSVHANAFHNRDLHGTAVYVLSDKGATNEHARWLARKENEADLVGGVEIHGKDKELAAVLIDLSQSATMEASFDVGGRILKSMGKVNKLQKADVQQAGFMVLKAPDIPSVLVETAFITNEREEALLADDDYREKLARSILDGIKGYFVSYRPQQQMVEAVAGPQEVSLK